MNVLRLKALLFFTLLLSLSATFTAADDHDGCIRTQDCRRLFPLGFYELPADDAELARMAESGINLIRCHNRESLDRVSAAGMMGIMSLNLGQGRTEALEKQILDVRDHPALALWEGPDEIVWLFTGWSRYWREGPNKIYDNRGEWWMQTDKAVEFSEKKADEIIPKLLDGIELVRDLDSKGRQVWLNEARNSDVKFCRRYMDHIDITGCDYYPIIGEHRDAVKIGKTTERWMQTGRGKPVWMVLQAFSWSSLGGYATPPEAYPSFDESRMMAYISIVYGAKGVLYWGSNKDRTPPDFRQSLYALMSELAELQPFLTADEEDTEATTTIECMTAGPVEGWIGEHESWPPPRKMGVRSSLRRSGDDWLVILVNEDDSPHYGVEVSGLDALNGRELKLLYGSETAMVGHGDFVTRMKPFEVKVFATGSGWETDRLDGREYKGVFAK